MLTLYVDVNVIAYGPLREFILIPSSTEQLSMAIPVI